MKHYQITSDSFEGYIDLHYNDADILIEYSLKEANLSEAQQVFILKHLPREISDLDSLKNLAKSLVITEIKLEVTFDMFWIRYDDKLNSSRKKTLIKWNKMNKTDQIKAFQFIPTYFINLPNGTRKKYAETYLNAELWNN